MKKILQSSFSRRSFLKSFAVINFSKFIASEFLHQVNSNDLSTSKKTDNTKNGISYLHLQADNLQELLTFYQDNLGFLAELKDKNLRVFTGNTVIDFEQTKQPIQPIYHIAWAIPNKKFQEAKTWLAQRTPLLKHPDGRDEFHFERVNRRAIYFQDPAGNVLELIARYNLKEKAEGPFGLNDILYVNHVGLVVDEIRPSLHQIEKQLGLKPRGYPANNFATIGDEYRHLALVTKDRLWLPEFKHGAKVFSTELILHGAVPKSLNFPNFPYAISIKPSL